MTAFISRSKISPQLAASEECINYRLTSFLSFSIFYPTDSRKFASLFESPLTERIRKRRAFADSRLMSAPILMEIPSSLPAIPRTLPAYLTPAAFIPLKPLILPPLEFAQRSLQLMEQSPPLSQSSSSPAPSKPKLSFSIESIIGVKWIRARAFSGFIFCYI